MPDMTPTTDATFLTCRQGNELLSNFKRQLKEAFEQSGNTNSLQFSTYTDLLQEHRRSCEICKRYDWRI